MRAWVYKVNSKRPGRRSEAKTPPALSEAEGSLPRGFTGTPAEASAEAGWHFDQYFRYRGRRPYDMGGREWIRSPLSWQRLRQVRRGDLFICYQADERKIYGLARTASAGYESLPNSDIFDSVDFVPPQRGGACRLKKPVSVQHPQARDLFQHIRAFTVPSRGTIHALAPDELRALLRILGDFNPAQRRALLAFARLRA